MGCDRTSNKSDFNAGNCFYCVLIAERINFAFEAERGNFIYGEARRWLSKAACQRLSGMSDCNYYLGIADSIWNFYHSFVEGKVGIQEKK